MNKTVMCIDDMGCGYIKKGQTYEVLQEDSSCYHIRPHTSLLQAEYPEGIRYIKHRFVISAKKYNSGCTEDIYAHISKLEQKLETKIRQLQDQLDHHNHKDNIDFTVEREQEL